MWWTVDNVDTDDHNQAMPIRNVNKVIRCRHLMTSKQPVTNFLPQTVHLGTLLIKQGDAYLRSLDYAGGHQSTKLRVLDSFKRSHTTRA